MIAGELRGKVGVAPSTTTLYSSNGSLVLMGAEEKPALTEDQYRAADIAVRQREVFWTGLASFGTSALSILTLTGVAIAFLRTGTLKTPKP